MSFLHEVIKASPEVAQGLRVPAESERDALRAEVERYKRALERLSGMVDCHECPFGANGSQVCVTNTCAALPQWALSEAGKVEA